MVFSILLQFKGQLPAVPPTTQAVSLQESLLSIAAQRLRDEVSRETSAEREVLAIGNAAC